MSGETIVFIIACIVIPAAVVYGRWILIWKPAKKRKASVAEAYIKGVEKSLPEVKKALKLLPNYYDWSEHPADRHFMRFISKNFNMELSVIVYRFRCLYCKTEVRIAKRDYWGKK